MIQDNYPRNTFFFLFLKLSVFLFLSTLILSMNGTTVIQDWNREITDWDIGDWPWAAIIFAAAGVPVVPSVARWAVVGSLALTPALSFDDSQVVVCRAAGWRCLKRKEIVD